MHRIRHLIESGQTAFGSFVSTTAAEVVEILGQVGLDFVVVDEEHGCFGRESVRNLILASRSVGIACLVRIRENHGTLISQALDDGADGVVVPHVDTCEDAVRAVRAAKYHPEGNRSIAQTTRATGYRVVNQEEYVHRANAETIVVALVESQTGLDNLGEIVQVRGLDAILLGHRDLAQSMGLVDDIQNQAIIESFQKVARCARTAGLAVMASVSRAAEAEPFIRWGARLLIIGKDMRFLYSVYESQLQEVRQVERGKRLEGYDSRPGA